MKYEDFFAAELKSVEEALEASLPVASVRPSIIHEAMRYSVFPAGKRFRPVILLSVASMLGGDRQAALKAAVSLELIHCYSLVHDDLPCMDDDDERRGRPTCHKKFGESIALLAGDGLLTHAFQVLTGIQPAARAIRLLGEISTAAGTCGMIGGQVAELAAAGEEWTLPTLDYIHVHKTGKLITASAVCGAIVAEADSVSTQHIRRYGEMLGMAFQLVDDLHDRDGYLKLMSATEVAAKVRDLMAQAKMEVRGWGSKAEPLIRLADELVLRSSL